jgi:methylenetetrahydrofolate dehydrogenase (NADP+) / methenyltetrahydrofolate cyclohydrolase
VRVDGPRLADRLLDRLAEQVRASDDPPGCLATVVVADGGRSHRQAALKHRACERVGMDWRAVRMPERAETDDVLQVLAELDDDAEVDGIFVHVPLPEHVAEDRVAAAVPARKDVDGLNPAAPFLAASAHGVVDVLHEYDVPLASCDTVVIGDDSALVRGLRKVLAKAGSLAVLAPDAALECSRRADVVISAAYRPGLVTGRWVREGAVVIDAASGDLDVASVEDRAAVLCASPGGIGPLTVARLLIATQDAARGAVGTVQT